MSELGTLVSLSVSDARLRLLFLINLLSTVRLLLRQVAYPFIE